MLQLWIFRNGIRLIRDRNFNTVPNNSQESFSNSDSVLNKSCFSALTNINRKKERTFEKDKEMQVHLATIQSNKYLPPTSSFLLI